MPNNISEISATINTLLESNDAAQAEHNNIINDKTSIYNRHQYIAQQIAKKHKYVAQQIAKLNEHLAQQNATPEEAKICSIIQEIIKLNENIAKKEDDIAKQKKCLDEKEKTVLKKIAAIEKETDEILKHESSNNGEPSVFNFDNPTGAIAKDANTTVPQMLDIQNIQKTLKIKKIPIISEKDSNSQNYVVITGYNGFEVAIGTVNEIVANYREHVLSRSKGLQPQKITVGNSNDLWGDILRYKSKIELPADNQIIQIIDLYCKEVLELLGPRSSVVYAPNKVATETLIKEDDVIEKKISDLGKVMKIKQIPTLEHECCSQDTITAVVIDDKYEVIIGTTEEIITSYSNAYRIARGQDTLAVSIYPRIVSATKETMDIYWLNHWANILADDQGKIASWKPGKVIYQYCIDFLSERGAELSTSNFVINEHKVLIDEPFNPDLSNGAQSNHAIICGGKDVVDSNEQEAVIGATAQEDDSY